ncbi:hypothetical protein [Dysgonomonas sp. 520]|uniref:hypothetical protein n=1 Tax=Dysgonomonas sp. 520 TaxID=2302931 RepID=UPI0013D4FF5F|nr:hypothetical protein [Dysgonomonas sp. 520]NDW10446.1 hypothetical protein [Dysgonomonas sp. 520]
MTDTDIIESIRRLGAGEDKCFIATVTNNRPDKDYVDVTDMSGTQYPEVRKRAALIEGIENSGILITPTNESTVIVNRIGESDELYIAMYSDVESIVFDGGKNGGLTITPELKTQLDKLTARVDGIISAIKNGKPGVQDGGTALQQTIVSGLNTITDKENFSNIENDKIKH